MCIRTLGRLLNRASNRSLYHLTGLFALATLFMSCQTSNASKAGLDLSLLPDTNSVGAAHLPEEIEPVSAPFAMPEFKRPVFADLTVNIKDLGAEEGKKATTIIQKAIDEVNAKGGGTVLIPDGHWFTGRINLKSNVNLHLSDNAELKFSGAVEDYWPAVFTRNEGIEVMSLGACIYANGQDNIAVTGKGKLVGPEQGGTVRSQVMDTTVIENFVSYKTPVEERVYDGKDGGYIFLPMFISPINCTNVFIEGVSLSNTAFWNVVPVYCDGVIIRGIQVESVGIPRGDGIDVESSKNVLIEYSTLNCGDDCFTIKSGRGEDGLRVGKATENVVIRNCLALRGHGGVTCGSETAGMIRNLYVNNCVFNKTNVGIRFKTRRPRGGGGEDLYYENIRMNKTGKAFQWDMLGGSQYVGDLAARLPERPIDSLTPVFRKITAKNILIQESDWFVKVSAIPERPLTEVLFEHMEVNATNFFTAADVDGFTLKDAKIHTEDSLLTLLDVRNLSFNNVDFEVPGGHLLTNIEGPKSEQISFENCTPERPEGWTSNTYEAKVAN